MSLWLLGSQESANPDSGICPIPHRIDVIINVLPMEWIECSTGSQGSSCSGFASLQVVVGGPMTTHTFAATRSPDEEN